MENEKENTVKYSGVLELGNNVKIDCYVLENGTRVLSGREMQRALNMVEENEESSKTAGTRLVRHLNQKSLLPFIYKGKDMDHFNPIICYKGEKKINGYEATILIDICDAFLQARKEIKLSARQTLIADQCEILVRSFAKVGLIALIDEATGYQYEREKFELASIMKLFVSDEILAYQQQFQISFYKEIFRLWNIPFTPENIKRKPQFIGHLTNKFVYSNLPKGVFILDKLKSKTPKTGAGNYKYRLHQSLTEDVGRESLKKVLYSVEALASISKDKRQFERLMNEKYGQTEIPFTDLEELDSAPETPKQTKQEPLSKFNQNLKKALDYKPKKRL